MNKGFTAIFLILFFLLLFSLVSQESDQNRTGANNPLFFDTLAEDINTASYYELVSWCKSLNLEADKGTREDFQQRVYRYYGIEPGTPPEGPKEKVIRIRSARNTKYFKIERIAEDYVELLGDVTIEMEDTKEGVEHIIKADNILYNQEQNTITAQGNLEYTKTATGKEPERFTGSSLTFFLDTWEGIIIDAVSESERKLERKKSGVINQGLTETYLQPFTYLGGTIYHYPDDVIIFSPAAITSQPRDDPYFHLDAERIWMLAPDEWALSHAVLYIGKIPVFYFPFFFHAGEELIFHPVIGHREIEGSFVQTTTYFIGQKQKSPSSFSFLQPGADDSAYTQEPHGLFLKKKESTGTSDGLGKNYLKFMFDLYSRLGLYSGLEAALASGDKALQLDVYVGAALSRNIYSIYSSEKKTTRYSPYWYVDDSYQSSWNHAYLLGADIPLRYGTDINFSLDKQLFSVLVQWELLSDTYFYRDFGNRSENSDWLFNLLSEQDSSLTSTDTTDSSQSTEKRSAIKKNLNWKLETKLLTKNLIEPYVQSFNINRFNFSMNWNSYTEPVGTIHPSYETQFFDPETFFFYPVSYKAPDIKMLLSGTLFSSRLKPQKKSAVGKQKGELPFDSFILPWEDEEKTAGQETADQALFFLLPPFFSDEPLPDKVVDEGYDQEVTYQIIPSFSIDNSMQYSLWKKPADVDFQTAYSILTTATKGNLKYQGNLNRDLLAVTDTLSVDAVLARHFNPSDERLASGTWLNDQVVSFSKSKLMVDNRVSFKYVPFLPFDLWKKTDIRYNLAAILFQKAYAGLDGPNPIYKDTFLFKDYWIQWKKNIITQHDASINLKYYFLNQWQSYSIAYILPPLDQVLTNTLVLITGPITSTLEHQAVKEEPNWKGEYFRITERYSFTTTSFLEEKVNYNFDLAAWDKSTTLLTLALLENAINVKQNFEYSLYHLWPESSSSVLKIGWFDTTFVAKRTYPSTFNIFSLEWVDGPSEVFLPASWDFNLNFHYKSDLFWKNRIQYSTKLGGGLNLDLIRVNQSAMTFNVGFTFSLYKFLDLTFSSRSENSSVYRYIPGFSERVNPDDTWINPLVDILKSFNFFQKNSTDRKLSQFNLKELKIIAVHHLEDWDITFEYEGKPYLDTTQAYPFQKWVSNFSLFFQWRPIPEIHSTVTSVDDKLSF